VGENRKKKAKLPGQGKDSFTEQQRKITVTTITLTRTREFTEQRSPPDAQRAPKLQFTSPQPAPPSVLSNTMRAHGSEYPFVGPIWVSRPSCVPSWLLVKVNPIPAKPRTEGR